MEYKKIKDYYPTSRAGIEKLLEGLPLKLIGSFLDACAGDGRIAEYLKEETSDYYDRHADIDVIEIDDDLQAILKGKGLKLIHDDFLTLRSRKAYGAIIANFPFSIGDKCLEKALQMIERYGGILRCYVNAETIRNPHTTLRQAVVAKLDAMGAEIEYLEGMFEDAERSTDVEVALIKLEIEAPEPFSFVLEGMRRAQAARPVEVGPDELISTNYIEAAVARFDVEAEGGVRLLNEFYGMRPHILDRVIQDEDDGKYAGPILELKVNGKDERSLPASINGYLEALREKYWKALLKDERFGAAYTSNVLKEMDRKVDELIQYDFSLFNIREMQREMNSKIIAGIEAAIIELFDLCTAKHAYGEDFGTNRWLFNGWKSNSAYKVRKKIVLPMYGALRSNYSGGSQLGYDTPEKLMDMVKVFNYLARDRVNVRQLVGTILEKASKQQNFNFDLRYFKVKLYKKGTIHITFLDDELLEKFNIFGCQRKNWLPPAYGRKRYSEMSPEEREVTEAFHGEAGRAGYEKVMKDAAYYIVDPQQLLLVA